MAQFTPTKSPAEYCADGGRYDCTGHIGDLFPDTDPAWPMYSFSRPARIFWNTVAAKMHAAGWSDARIQEWLQSKSPRWCLDGTWGDALVALAEKLAAEELGV